MDTGAVSKTECVAYPALNEMSKVLIIVACSIAFAFLCLVIIMYLQYRHQWKNDDEDKNAHSNARYMTPNVYAQAPPPNQKCPDYIRGGTVPRGYFVPGHDYEDIDGHHKSVFETFPHQAPGCRDSLSSFKAQTDMTFLHSPSPNGTNSFRASEDPLMVANSPRASAKSLNLYTDGGFQYTMSPNGTLGSFKGSPPASPYRSLHLTTNPMTVGESPSHGAHSVSSLMGDESPYTSRLIRDRLIDPESPYRIISHDRRSGTESPYKVKRKIEVENPHMSPQDATINYEGPYRLTPAKESPYRSPAFQRELSHSLRVNTDVQHRSPTFPQATDIQNSFRTMPESPNLHRQMSIPQTEASSFMANGGDFLYKRPPSPLSPPISSRKSSDSLQRSPSTPRASPGMSRKRIDNFHRTPPSHRRKIKNEMDIYEYE